MSNPAERRPDGAGYGMYAGIFLLCLSTLVYEIALTRIFSALMYYHFASMAIAIAFLGMGLGGIIRYLKPEPADADRKGLLFRLCVFYAVSILALYGAGVLASAFPDASAGFLTQFHQPYFQPFRRGGSDVGWSGALTMAGLAAGMMVPFLLAGLGIASLLAGVPEKVSRLYLADLLGAGAGALLVIGAISLFGGPGALLVAAGAGFAAALAFSQNERSKSGTVVVAALLALTGALCFIEYGGGLVKLNFVGGRYEPGVLETRWNSFSRVLVYKGKTMGMQERAWGVSREYKGNRPEELNIVINDTGYTAMVKASPGADLGYLKYDVTNLPFMLKEKARALVIGPGGGKDVLSALEFGSMDVTAVEVNPLLKDIVDGSFGEFTGRLYSRPGVRLVIDDGRSFLMRDRTKYDVIESARVYEWMEATSGAFSLSENYLYTKEAFVDYLGHLNDGGFLSITRFIFEKQALRIVSLALAAYGEVGVDDPSDRIAVLKERGLATFLFKRSAFTKEEIEKLSNIAAKMGFGVVYLPGRSLDNEFARYITARDKAAFVAAWPQDISPSTDDNPFFNFMVKRGDFWKSFGIKASGFHNQAAVFIKRMAAAMMALSFALFFAPMLLFRRERVSGGGMWLRLAYFGAIGLGFMLVEITFLRKFILFLGHPIYSLSVVLFVLLAAAGLGSMISGKLKPGTLKVIIWTTPAVVLLYAVLPDLFFEWFLAGGVAVRVAVSTLLLAPAGFLLGMPFPAGIHAAACAGQRDGIPWFWAVNGFFSVFGTVLALILAMNFGFTFTLVAGGLLYLAAAFAYRPAEAHGIDG